MQKSQVDDKGSSNNWKNNARFKLMNNKLNFKKQKKKEERKNNKLYLLEKGLFSNGYIKLLT